MRAPGSSHRTSIIGRTGSGKTQAGVWHLSRQDFHKRPWTIFDFKGDALIGRLNASVVKVTSKPPRKPGLYVVRPLPGQDESVEEYLWNLWRDGKHGLYIDEGYMIDRESKAMCAVLTQGRSKGIPAIVLSQRPVWMNRFVFSEADFFQVFHLNSIDDRKTVERYVPADLQKPLEAYHSIYHDIGRNETTLLKPVPKADSIVATFRKRLEPRRRNL